MHVTPSPPGATYAFVAQLLLPGLDRYSSTTYTLFSGSAAARVSLFPYKCFATAHPNPLSSLFELPQTSPFR